MVSGLMKDLNTSPGANTTLASGNKVIQYDGAGNTWRGNAFTYTPSHGF
jgi:hypothetical protein